mmetsp:Transcript_58930/g.149545  ORF Transcript_58930/g.149545 Transcript_58930/m.149545 type:complete len:96 (+) Transcript_58930:94-381(+)
MHSMRSMAPSRHPRFRPACLWKESPLDSEPLLVKIATDEFDAFYGSVPAAPGTLRKRVKKDTLAEAAFDAHREGAAPLASDVESRREQDALVVPR